jgi:hypothetical protein
MPSAALAIMAKGERYGVKTSRCKDRPGAPDVMQPEFLSQTLCAGGGHVFAADQTRRA